MPPTGCREPGAPGRQAIAGSDGRPQAVEFFQRQHVGLRQDEPQPKIALPVANPAKLNFRVLFYSR
jgi:hypothetical protein